jgi:HEAT repeat protein
VSVTACVVLAVCVALSGPWAADGQQPRTGSHEAQILANLSSPDQTVRETALLGALAIRPPMRSPALREALAKEFLRVVRDDAGRQRRGAPSSERDDDYLGALVQANTESDDPALIPAFVHVVRTGTMAQAALSHYGEPALRHLLPILEQADVSWDAVQGVAVSWDTVQGAVNSVVLMLHNQDKRPVPVDLRRRVAAAARHLLQVPKAAGPLGILPVIDLAAATGEPDLLDEVRHIAQDPSLLVGRGVPSTALDFVKKRASEALSKRGAQ